MNLAKEGIKLSREGKAGAPAFLLFLNADSTKIAELFMPDAKFGILLPELPNDGAGAWKNKTYRLSQWKGMYSLDDAHGHTLYQGMIAP